MFSVTDDSIDSGTRVTGANNPAILKQAFEARRIFEQAVNGVYTAKADLREAMSTSDFPVLLGVSYARELQREYDGISPVWPKFAKRTTAANFKEFSLVDLLGGKGELSVIEQGAEYPARKLSESSQKMKLRKRGARIPLTWEMLINDDLGAFRDLPTRLAVAARETEDTVAVRALLKADLSDVNTAFFKSANGNAPASAALTKENLEAALDTIYARKSTDGRPLTFGTEKARLMVPQALEGTARAILDAREFRTVDADGVTAVSVNSLGSRVELVVNPWLDVLSTHAKKATTWYILPAPSAPRVAIAEAFLTGYESPDIRVKSDAGQRPGGGIISPEQGSFGSDTIEYRVRHVVEAGTFDPILTYVSYGS